MIVSVHLCWSYDGIVFSIFVLDYEAQMNLTVILRVRGSKPRNVHQLIWEIYCDCHRTLWNVHVVLDYGF